MHSRKKPAAASKPAKATKPKPNTQAAVPAPASPISTALPPTRAHHASYHYPLLLNDKAQCDALLIWFEGEEETRSMPWRKAWIDPSEYADSAEELGPVLGKRAYEIWVSEVMLQQTRVSTVIPYFNNWISKWPTVRDLADASHDDVLSVWKGLGYYSRATRLHEGAKAMIAKSAGSSCPLPSSAAELQEFPGIGRYTAGAISSIAFGQAEPVLDGNVARVLSRQLGLYMDVKDKKATDILWDLADRLIKSVSGSQPSSTPGQWNQAMMELGSTICTPRPRCDECPIQSTCRVYGEGQVLLEKQKTPIAAVPDIEDACALCDILDAEDLASAQEDTVEKEPAPKKRKAGTRQANTISNYFAVGTPKSSSIEPDDDDGGDNDEDDADVPFYRLALTRKRKTAPETPATAKQVQSYCALFPKKVAKKKAAEEQCVVVMVEKHQPDGSSKWLIEQRPDKGLLASLWQFPQAPTPASTPHDRQTAAETLTSHVLASPESLALVSTFPPLVHVFSHLRLTMWAFRFRVDAHGDGDLEGGDDPESITAMQRQARKLSVTAPDHAPSNADAKEGQAEGNGMKGKESVDCTLTPTSSSSSSSSRKWVSTASMDDATLSTGMRRCWDLVCRAV